LTGIASICASLLLLTGFIYAVNDILFPAPAVQPDDADASAVHDELRWPQDEIKVAAIGDSLTKGTGDSTGAGYVRHAVQMLQDKLNKPVRLLNNLAVNGLQADQLLAQLDETGVQYALKQADIILMTIGGNDLFRTAVGRYDLTSGDLDPNLLYDLLPEAISRLEAVLIKLHELNPEARIIYVGLFNPFYDLDETRVTNEIIQEWNMRAYRMINRYPNMTLVPVIDLFQNSINRYLASDHFHPNDAGYIRIAERVVQTLE
jgi:lysophospholipase L1-like esterase